LIINIGEIQVLAINFRNEVTSHIHIIIFYAWRLRPYASAPILVLFYNINAPNNNESIEQLISFHSDAKTSAKECVFTTLVQGINDLILFNFIVNILTSSNLVPHYNEIVVKLCNSKINEIEALTMHLSLFLFNILFLTSNHKRLGLYYLWLALLFGISGTLCSLILRYELYSSGNRIIPSENQNFYNLSFTLHGILMIFFLVMPSLYGGFGNYFIPLLIAAPEVVFPRINSFSLLLLAVSYGCIIFSSTSEFGGGTGWTLYPPLSTSQVFL
jgi:hypothetical protein